MGYASAKRIVNPVGLVDQGIQAVDDLVDIEGVDSERASKLIMTARAPWFANEQAANK